MKKILVQVNSKCGKPITMCPDLVGCDDIHQYVDSHLTPDSVLILSTVNEYDITNQFKNEPCHEED